MRVHNLLLYSYQAQNRKKQKQKTAHGKRKWEKVEGSRSQWQWYLERKNDFSNTTRPKSIKTSREKSPQGFRLSHEIVQTNG